MDNINNKLAKKEEFLLKEYDSAQKLTYHIDELRSKLTQFFLAFTGVAITALTLLIKKDTSLSILGEKPEKIINILIFSITFLDSICVLIIAKLRSVQIEHFRIINNIRDYFLKEDYDLWNRVQLSGKTLPKPSLMSGSYLWVLLIISTTSLLFSLSFSVNQLYFKPKFGFFAFIFLNILYFIFAQPLKLKKYSKDNLPINL